MALKCNIPVSLLLLLFIFPCTGNSQFVSQEDQGYIVKGTFTKLRVDDFKNIYLLDDNNNLKKFDKNLNPVFDYSFLSLGEVTDLDVKNPTKLVVFFSDYQLILFLDNTLSEINRLSLEDLGFWNITSVTQSPDNHMWIYDPVNFKILKINESGKILYSSNEFYFDQISREIQPKLKANLNYVLCHTDSEYTIFTNFGELYRTVKDTTAGFEIRQDKLLYNKNNSIWLENIKPDFLNPPVKIYESEMEIRDFQLSKTKELYILDSMGVRRIKLN